MKSEHCFKYWWHSRNLESVKKYRSLQHGIIHYVYVLSNRDDMQTPLESSWGHLRDIHHELVYIEYLLYVLNKHFKIYTYFIDCSILFAFDLVFLFLIFGIFLCLNLVIGFFVSLQLIVFFTAYILFMI